MGNTVIKVENLSKQYRLGLVGASTFKEDASRWWAKMRGKEDPFLALGSENDRTSISDSKFVWSLKDINLEIKQGDVIGIVGRNGAGKSTLLKILSKITSPTTGTVKAKGRIASLLEVGTGFHPELTGRENIFLNGAILGMRKHEIKSKLDEIIAFAGVERYIDTPVKRYSSGMYVRLAFAVAAHLESEILIVDEVLAVGDTEFQKTCIGKMNEISSGQGKTILFVSHNIATLQHLCKNGILLKNGKLDAYDSMPKVLDRYYNNFNITKSIPLSNRDDRTGNGDVKLVDFRINNKEAQIGCYVFCGDQININFEYKSIIGAFKGKFNIGIYDKTMNRILFLDSSIIDNMPHEFDSNAKISISLSNEFSLGVGEYFVNFAIIVNEILTDYIQNVCFLEVKDSDFFNSGKMPPKDTILLVKQKWVIENL